MAAEGIVVQPGEGLVSHSSTMAGRSYALKLLGAATGDSIMLFEETVPAGTKSTFHLHRDSDEVAYVLEGEITFLIGGAVTTGGAGSLAFMPRGVPHAWKNSGGETGKVLFLYTPAKAGGLLEEQHETQRSFSAMSAEEVEDTCRRHGWEVLGPSPL
jgi:quercetin dioxygenase-like cupin family protein